MVPKERLSWVVPVFTLLITVSGLAALVYQVVWTRLLSLIFGVSMYAVATVLAAFLGGLALGAWTLGGALDRARRPLRAYALLEAGIGVLALSFPFLLEELHALYILSMQGLEVSRTIDLLARAALCTVLVLPPTFLMGATLPAMCRVMVRDVRVPAADLGRVYAYNTLGAAVGALLAGFILIAWLGLRGSLWFAGALNLTVAAVALLLARRGVGEEAVASPVAAGPPASPPPRRLVTVVLGASAVSGFAALGYEVLWTRALVTVLHTGFTYAFSLMLATFLGGLVLGSLLYARTIAGRRDSLAVLARVQLLLGAAALSSVWLLAQIPYLERLAAAAGLLPPVYTWSSWLAEMSVASLAVMLIPTTLMGIALPLSASLLVGRGGQVGRWVGVLYGVNTIGSILGALLTGFVLIPLWGTLNSLAFLASCNLILGAALTWLGRAAPTERAVALAGAGSLVLASVLLLPGDYLQAALNRWKPGQPLYFAEDVTGVVSIYQEPAAAGDYYRRLYVNETSYASTTAYSRRYHKLLGHLPALLHPGPERVLVIAFGTGMTAGALARHAEVEQIDCVDLSPAVLDGAPYFARENGGVLQNPRTRVTVEDGRHHLLLSGVDYDVITLEPPPPRFAGVANLYSRDFYALCRDRLREGGVVAQWIPMHSHTEEEMRMLVRSFVEVFPHSTLWLPVQRDAILVGGIDPPRVALERLGRGMAQGAVALDLADIDFDTPASLAVTWFADEEGLARYVEGVKPITDDRPVIEFFLGRALVETPVHLERLLPYRMGFDSLVEGLADGPPQGTAVYNELRRGSEALDHFYRGAVLAARGDAAGRSREWLRALELDPDNSFFLRLNGRARQP